MVDIVVVFSKTLDPPSDLTEGLFKRLHPFKCAVISTHFKLFTKNAATEMTQQIDERQHLFAGNCVFSLFFDNVRLKYETGCSTPGLIICESTPPMPKSLASQSTMNNYIKSGYARVIVS